MDAASTVLRGRLRESAQLTRRLAQPWPLEIRYDEFTADIAENRILASAVERLLRVPGVRPQSRRILRHLAGRFPGVALLRPGAPLPSWQPTRLNAALQPALHLAELALTRASVDVSAGAVTSSGLLLDLATLFQDFLAAALRVALAGRHGGRLVAEPADHHLDVGGRFAIRPDLVWRRGGTVAAVIDAKYKRHVPVADAYQMLAYCTAFGLPRGHLVYVTGGDRPTRHVVRNAGTEIVCHCLDLAQPPDVLLRSVADLADRVGGGPPT